MRTKEFKETKGITLIALIITIIVLLILAGVSIMTLTGENRTYNKSNWSKGKNRNSRAQRRNTVMANRIWNR